MTATTGTLLRPRVSADLANRLMRSVQATEGAGMATGDVPGWIRERGDTNSARVDHVPFKDLDGWGFAEVTGDLTHHSGKFFTIAGLHVQRPGDEWQQPIILQNEIGTLGILAKEFDGVLHFLMQAKMEPGNPNLVQLSPTVQATKSNQSRVHGGSPVQYLGCFSEPLRQHVLADVLQSEHGAWFLQKRNRNMVIETRDEVPLANDNFAWFTMGQLGQLMRADNVVNMDARTVLASLPMMYPDQEALLSDGEVQSWFIGERARNEIRARRIPLAEVRGWVRDEDAIHRPDRRFFRVIPVAVSGGDREVPQWTQPLIEQLGSGVIGFAMRRFAGVPHFLVSARGEGGLLDNPELGPTVQCVPPNHVDLPSVRRPRFLDALMEAPTERVLYSAVHSEEGGRFYNSVSQHVIVETDEASTPTQPPPGYQWMTPGQLSWLAGQSRSVNVQARSLLAALHTHAAGLEVARDADRAHAADDAIGGLGWAPALTDYQHRRL